MNRWTDYSTAMASYIQTSPPPQAQAPEPKPKKPRHRALRGIALILACLLLGGAAGVGAPLLLNQLVISEDVAPEPSASPIYLPDAQKTAGVVVADDGGKLTAADIYASAVDACVGLSTTVSYQSWFGTQTGDVTGSGFFVSADGYIVTNAHVVEAAYEQGLDVTISMYDGTTSTAQIVGLDTDQDVALLKMESDKQNLKYLTLGTLDNMRIGDDLYVIGNPLGYLTFSLTEGVLSAFDREVRLSSDTAIDMFQMTAAINSGSSGGPVLNARGEVIGIASAKPNSSTVEGVYFAIPVDDVRGLITKWQEQGYRPRAMLGVTVTPIDGTDRNTSKRVRGAGVIELTAGGAAETAGIRVGDVITRVDDHEVTSNNDLISIMRKNYAAGDTATFTLYRSEGGKGAEVKVTVTFTAPEDAPEPEPSSTLPDYFN